VRRQQGTVLKRVRAVSGGREVARGQAVGGVGEDMAGRALFGMVECIEGNQGLVVSQGQGQEREGGEGGQLSCSPE